MSAQAPESGVVWIPQGSYEDVLFDLSEEGIARIRINRPEKRNAFRPKTVMELFDAFSRVRDNPRIGVVLFSGVGPAADGGWAFCAGGDQSVRGDGGYVGDDGLPRLNVLDLQRLIRSLPKVVIALVAGYAVGGGQVLHLLCDLSLAADNAVFGQTGPRVGSFDGGFGAGYLARVVLTHSPTAIRCLKAAFNAETDGLAGIQELAGQATHLFYRTEEGQEGRNAFLEKRAPDFSGSPWLP